MSQKKEALTKREILEILEKDGGRVHFIGVGGVSMCALFCLSRHFGISVSGSDAKESELLKALKDSGEDIFIGERMELGENVKLVVYSHAVREGHHERIMARERGIPEITRAEYLGALMLCYDCRVGVSGSHGKSTVTAMLSKIFTDSGKSPTTLSGANLHSSSLPFSIGSLDYLIYEACEYKDSFLSFSPTVALFLNMELDHTDYFKDKEALSSSFFKAMKRAEKIIVNRDDEPLYALAKSSGKRVISYGAGEGADYRYEIISEEPKNMRFFLFRNEKRLGEVTLHMLGSFNISNAAAATAVAIETGVDFNCAGESLSEFFGIERRLERIGAYKGREVYYDYAHHPTEIKASVRAVRSLSKKGVTVIFRPHTYSRTVGLWDDFCAALSEADGVVLLDIDAVREEKTEGVSSEKLAKEIGAYYLKDIRDLEKALDSFSGDVILMGAADVFEVKKILDKRISEC